MKKLMILGAIAASMVGYGAEASFQAQVYDVSLTMKTTVCKPGKVTAATIKYYTAYFGKAWVEAVGLERGDEMGFRQPATRTIKGVIWGCDCETIAFPAWRVWRGQSSYNLGGYVFWDQSVQRHFFVPRTLFSWLCLNRVNSDFKKVEGAWTLANNAGLQGMIMRGAGFGNASIAARPCRSIIQSMSGSFAGARVPGLDALVSDCAFCGVGNCNVQPFCRACRVFTFAPWMTAAYGNWTIKFNQQASQKLKQTARITKSYNWRNAKAGQLPTILANMETFVHAVGRNNLAGWSNIAVGDRVGMTWGDVAWTYLYGLNPSAFSVANGALVYTPNFSFADFDFDAWDDWGDEDSDWGDDGDDEWGDDETDDWGDESDWTDPTDSALPTGKTTVKFGQAAASDAEAAALATEGLTSLESYVKGLILSLDEDEFDDDDCKACQSESSDKVLKPGDALKALLKEIAAAFDKS